MLATPRTRLRAFARGALPVAILWGCGGAAGESPSGDARTAGTSDPMEAPHVMPETNRPDVRGVHGAVSSGHPLATAAGYEVLRGGGNAVDAAVAMAGVLAVVRPHMNGVGGDAFAIFYDGATGEVIGMNGSGRAGALATSEWMRAAMAADAADAADAAEGGSERDGLPDTGPLTVSVPGAVRAWEDALERFGTRSLEELLQPAIRISREGFPVSTRLASDFEAQGGSLNAAGQDQFLPGGEPPAVGSLLRNPALARTLERIAREGSDGFYRGPVAETLAAFLEAEGGPLRAGDLGAHRTEWVTPLRADYRGIQALVLPPNTQGFAQLQQMIMAEALDLGTMGFNSAEYLHWLVELKKLAFADRDLWAADPAFVDVPLDRLLDPAYLRERLGAVDPERAGEDPPAGVPVGERTAETRANHGSEDDDGDTVYLTVVDADGNAVSWIQSLFAGFGSGLFEPETGVMLHNRGALFTLATGHPNEIEPGKRPYHTLTPMMALHPDGDLAFTLGTPGGDSQTQSLLAIVNNLLVFGMTPQAAIEAPRYRSYPGGRLALEDRVDPDVRARLAAMGHDVRVVHGWTATFGGAQMILVDRDTGTLVAAADPRREAYALAY